MTVSPTFRPDFAAFPETPVTFSPPPGLFELSQLEAQRLLNLDLR